MDAQETARYVIVRGAITVILAIPVSLASSVTHCVVASQPLKIETRIGNAWAQLMAKNPKLAIAEANEALKIDPRNSDAYYYRSIALEDLHQFGPALLDSTKALSLLPKDASPSTRSSYLAHRAVMLAQHGRLAAAVQDLDKAIMLEPSSTNYLHRGRSQLKRRRYKDALSDLTRSIHINPYDPDAYKLRAEVNRNLRRMPSSEEDARTATILLQQSQIQTDYIP